MKILYLFNSTVFFRSHFLTLAQRVLKEGHEVIIVADDSEMKKELELEGFIFLQIRISRKGTNFFSELNTLIDIYKVIKFVKPDIMHAFTIKPVIYSGLLNKIFRHIRVPLSVSSITGLGSVSLLTSFRGKLVWKIFKSIYRFIFSLSTAKVIFENSDDFNLFAQLKIISTDQAYIINGAGVDTSKFFPVIPKKFNTLKVTLVARLLKDKGVTEYIEAGRIIKERGVNAHLQLVGSVDVNNISSMSSGEITLAHEQGFIHYLGQRNDIANIYQQSHVACLPSYREGLPKSLIEAAACGLAIITTNVPGCRQMIFNGTNGILVEPKNAKDIADKIEILANTPNLVFEMGANSRRKAVEIFDHSSIIQSFLNIYDDNNGKSHEKYNVS